MQYKVNLLTQKRERSRERERSVEYITWDMEPNTMVRSFIMGISRGSSMSHTCFKEWKKYQKEDEKKQKFHGIKTPNYNQISKRKRKTNPPNIFSYKIWIHCTSHLHSSSSGHCIYCCPAYFFCCSIYNNLYLPHTKIDTERS
jgi:hypothetical protein